MLATALLLPSTKLVATKESSMGNVIAVIRLES